MPHSIAFPPTLQEESKIPITPLYDFNDVISESDHNDSEQSSLSFNNSPEDKKKITNVRIEELFGSGDEDDEFPSSSAPSTEISSKANGNSIPASPL